MRWTAYKTKRNEYSSEISISKQNAWAKFCGDINDAIAMAKVHKLMAKDPMNSPGVLRCPNGELSNSHEQSARVLLDTHFPGNVTSNDSAMTNIHFDFVEIDTNLVNFVNEVVTYDRTFWAISSFKPYKSPGYDNIYPVLLQKSWILINGYLMDVYKSSLRLGHIPKPWQKVKVVFIPKPGKEDYTSPKSFRPISLTSFMLKGMERLLDRFLKDHLEITHPFSCDQHAFQEGKSTETALHAITSLIEETIAQKEFAIATFLDIEGAFDNIPFTEVDHALENRGLSPLFRKWTMSLLRDRVITYESYGTRTSVTPTRGTPQGGVLSPTLWTLVIDVLLIRLKHAGIHVMGYADDITIANQL